MIIADRVKPGFMIARVTGTGIMGTGMMLTERIPTVEKVTTGIGV